MGLVFRSCLPSAGAALALVLVGTSTPAWAAVATPHQMPFPCGQTWTGSTRSGHSPSVRSIDWNRENDAGASVVASAPGVASLVQPHDKGGYGRYVVVDHLNGESSLYAHLGKVTVAAGQRVDQGAMLGAVGDSGNARGAHLHFEERIGREVVRAWFGGVPYSYGEATSANCVDVPVAGNFSGDALAEVAVFRRGRRSQFIVNEAGTPRVVPFGRATDEPVVGDWDGDGTANVGIRTPRGARFKLQTAGGVVKIVYGIPSDRPIAGDWNADGITDLGVRRPETASFYIRMPDGSTQSLVLGDADDLPVTGDWNGDRVTDLGVYDQATATFTLRQVDANGVAWTAQVPFGAVGDLPVTGDWDGNGVTDLGVWNPATATFAQSRAATPTSARTGVTTVRFGNPR
ncbi:hypothetical protein DDE18_05885 [Nocardioides gansuensis]|uniref:M23ase beta-sheet core domain-containing protein n=1 Tax=Nocardioides gansuensis TaxID=2138300 RepID=A0A2T8FDR1_9ACTN|nr:M23 family metallopeptidase [Nocardioides gansuensis]PVG83833.1 hypothetical protein DDE18_05885 [Nocardioides gansuensis]